MVIIYSIHANIIELKLLSSQKAKFKNNTLIFLQDLSLSSSNNNNNIANAIPQVESSEGKFSQTLPLPPQR